MRKNTSAQKTAEGAKESVLTIMFTILTLVSFTFIFNLPGIFGPISSLRRAFARSRERTKEANLLKQGDEFGDLANALIVWRASWMNREQLAKIKFKRAGSRRSSTDAGWDIGLDERRNILFLNAVSEKLLGLKEEVRRAIFAGSRAQERPDANLAQDDPDKKDLKIFADNKESYFSKDVLR